MPRSLSTFGGLLGLLAAGCAEAWSQPMRGHAVGDAGVTCGASEVAIDGDGHCGRPGQRWTRDGAVGAPTSCMPGETHAVDGRSCVARAHEDGPDGGPTTRWNAPPAAMSVPAGMVVLPGATWRFLGRWVRVGAFAMDRTEVTVGAWQRCVAARRCAPVADPAGTQRGAAYPVTNVTFAAAASYCTFAGGRLPTDAEWSLAARGVEGRAAPWGGRLARCDLARLAGCGDGPREVGSLPSGASPEGVLDLVGNVAEWVADRADDAPAPFGAAVENDPVGAAAGSARWVRGGSFRTADEVASARLAEAVEAREARVDLGFRCVRGL